MLEPNVTTRDGVDKLDEALQRYAHMARKDARLQVPPAHSVTVRNPSDGSQLTLDALIQDGRVLKLGHRVRACALGQAATMIVAGHTDELDKPTVGRMRAQLEAILAGRAERSDWPELEIFTAIQDVPNRHGAVLLPFQALEQLFDRAAERNSGFAGQPAGTHASSKE